MWNSKDHLLRSIFTRVDFIEKSLGDGGMRNTFASLDEPRQQMEWTKMLEVPYIHSSYI
ncbi:hypothetical protein Fmac_013053 [Flemingia macrophylla]|uniref:Uncharacterized protein n=1 Tax=Flemingia macrophylla TaxID=520843 RepID=A0ABD1MS21_9FABA